MSADKEKPGIPKDRFDGFVPAVFARDAKEAESYSQLLNDHDIPAICGADEVLDGLEESAGKARRRGMTHGVPVLVPEELLDEASEVIADRENLAEFALGDRGDEDDEDEDDEEGEEEEYEGPEELEDVDEIEEEDEEDLFGDEELDEDEDV